MASEIVTPGGATSPATADGLTREQLLAVLDRIANYSSTLADLLDKMVELDQTGDCALIGAAEVIASTIGGLAESAGGAGSILSPRA
jgi:hypothetical protein